MSEYIDNTKGNIQIADEVIAIIAATAAKEVENIYLGGNNHSESITNIFGRKNLAKGIKVNVMEGIANIEVDMAVKLGIKLLETGEEVQNKIKSAVETMTGLEVASVNVTISGIILEEEQPEEIEEEI